MTPNSGLTLVCAATRMELEAFADTDALRELSDSVFLTEQGEFAYLVSGVGVPCTFARLLPAVQRLRPTLLLNIGIAGAYPASGLSIGDIVLGDSEVYGDIGFELPEEPGFRSVTESAFGDFYQTPFPLTLPDAYRQDRVDLRVSVRRGCTVNACTGTEATGALRERLFQAGFESMEGAAVAQIGQAAGIPVCEVRAISNIAAHRDMRPENIGLALNNLRRYLERTL